MKKKFDYNFLDSVHTFHKVSESQQINFEPIADKIQGFSDALKEAEKFAFSIMNDGMDPETGAIVDARVMDKKLKEVADIGGIGSTSLLTQQVITRAVQMAKEPMSIFGEFSEKIAHKTGTQILIPYIGDATGARWIGPGQELPSLSFDRSAESLASCGKAGIKVELDDETMRTSNFNIMKFQLEKAKQALVRFKDSMAVRTLLSNGTVYYDNFDPANSVAGYTRGRSIEDGTLNGSFTLKDLFAMYTDGINKGYNLDTILVSQWGYLLFMYDPTLRQFMQYNGGVMFTAPRGTIGNNSRSMVAKTSRSEGPGKTYGELKYDIPSELANTNFKVIVTNYMPTYEKGDILMKSFYHTATTKNEPYTWIANQFAAATEGTGVHAVANVYANIGGTLKHPVDGDVLGSDTKAYCGDTGMTDLVMLDSSNALYYLEEEGVVTDKIVDRIYELTTVVLRERYSFVIAEQGRAVYVAKNLVINENVFDYEYNVQPTITETQAALAKETE